MVWFTWSNIPRLVHQVKPIAGDDSATAALLFKPGQRHRQPGVDLNNGIIARLFIPDKINAHPAVQAWNRLEGLLAILEPVREFWRHHDGSLTLKFPNVIIGRNPLPVVVKNNDGLKTAAAITQGGEAHGSAFAIFLDDKIFLAICFWQVAT